MEKQKYRWVENEKMTVAEAAEEMRTIIIQHYFEGFERALLLINFLGGVKSEALDKEGITEHEAAMEIRVIIRDHYFKGALRVIALANHIVEQTGGWDFAEETTE